MTVRGKEDLFKCYVCGGTFTKGWADTEAMEESVRLHGAVPEKELEAVCHDCHIKLMEWLHRKLEGEGK